MCGRYTLYHERSQLTDHFKTDFPPFTPRYNLAPSQRAPFVFLTAEEERRVGFAQWGLIPHWAKTPDSFTSLINARAETVSDKPSFQQAFSKGRCLIPASGYYEWAKQGDAKQPYYFHKQTKDPFALAGIFDVWRDEDSDERLVSYAIITTTPNEVAAQIHNRMPAILEVAQYETWLDSYTPLDAVKELLSPPADGWLETYPVAKRVRTLKSKT